MVINERDAPDRQLTAVRPSLANPTMRPMARDDQLVRGDATRPQPAPPTTSQAPGPHDAFSLVVRAATGEIFANVDPIDVASNQPVDPPHGTDEQWNTAVWVQQSSFPSVRSRGTTYVYGHACHYHVCSFTRLKDANVGDQVIVTTPAGMLTYQVAKIALSPKDASSLPSWASDSSVPNRLVLVTCAYESGDTSRDNLVVVAELRA